MGLDNPLHLAFIVVLLLLVFGAKRLPEMGKSLGAGMRSFKESISGETVHHQIGASTETAPAAARPAADAATTHPVAAGETSYQS